MKNTLENYAIAHGTTAQAFIDAGWKNDTYYGYEALSFTTNGGERYRVFDNESKFAGKGNKQVWYRLDEALPLIPASKSPLIIVNGEASVIAAQSNGLPATAITMGEKPSYDEALLEELKQKYTHDFIILAYDNDDTGRNNAPKFAKQLKEYGYVVIVIEWDEDLPEHYDIADWIRDNDVITSANLQRYGRAYTYNNTQEAEIVDEDISTDWADYFDKVLNIYPYERIGKELFKADVIKQSKGNIRFDNAGLGNLDINIDNGLWHAWRDDKIKGRGVITLLQLYLFADKYEQYSKSQKREAIQWIKDKTGIEPPQTKELVVSNPGDIVLQPETNNTNRKEYIMLMNELGYTFRYNEMNDIIEVNGEPLSDRLTMLVKGDLADMGYRREKMIELAIAKTAHDNAYHPIKDYLNSLVWNGHDYIADLAAHFIGPDDRPTQLFLRRWLIGAVAKVLDGQQNLVLVLEGPQGIGKSYFSKYLVSGLGKQYYSDNRLDIHDKDTQVRAISLFIWEIGELGATTRKVDYEALKAFLTQSQAQVRKAYGRQDIFKPIAVSYIGTVNNDGGGFLADPTGNRRFMVVPIDSIDRQYTNIDINHVWAQAVALFRSGEDAELTDEEKILQAEINSRYETHNPIEDLIDAKYVRRAGAFIPSREITEYIEENGRWGTTKQVEMEISKVLQKKGFKSGRKGQVRGFFDLSEKGFRK